MLKPHRYLLLSLASAVVATCLWVWMRPAATVTTTSVNHSYTQALEQAHNGEPGAARVLYQQLARTDLSDIRRASLHAELPNYPSPQALKLADADLHNPSALVREAAIQSIVGLVPGAQRTLLLGRPWMIRSKAYGLPPPTPCWACPRTSKGCISARCSK